MASTIVAVYDGNVNAEAAAKELKMSGFPIESFRVEHDVNAQQESCDAVQSMHSGNRGMMEFFASLIGPDAGAQSDSMRQSNSLIVVHAQNDEQADRVTEIMNRHHPIAVDERST
jgi:hypothetical protein